jgi:pilus assembly protein CpaE
MLSSTQGPDAPGANTMNVAVIGPDDDRRKAVAVALREGDGGALHGPEGPATGLAIQEFLSYPLELKELPRMLARHFEVVFIDLDSDTEYALNLVESLSRGGSATVMVYSAQANRDLVIRCMRAGAREFLNLPLGPGDMAGALARVPVRDPSTATARETGRRLFVFLGAKGGCGVTTVATAFALSLARDSGRSTLLIDFGLPLGDAALKLGMLCDYSTAHALDDWIRLDGSFLHSLLANHSSGLWVLAAPGEFPRTHAPIHAVNKLLEVAQQSFHYVVVDIGSRLDLKDSLLFGDSAYLYLVTQAGISELRNANRLITQLFPTRRHKLQIVLNRHMPDMPGFDDVQIARELTRPAQWKVPEESAVDKSSQPVTIPLAMGDSPASKCIRQMARAACGLPPVEGKKKSLSLFG